MIVMLISVKVTIPYLGAERFGAWMTIASIVGFLNFMDLGVGNALANQVSHAAASRSKSRLRHVVSGGLAFLFFLGVLISTGLYILLALLPWREHIKTGNPRDVLEMSRALSTLAILFGFSVFAGGVHRIFAGLQRAYEAHLVSFAFSLISLVLVLIAADCQAGIPILVTITLGVQILAGLFLVSLLMRRRIFVLVGAAQSAFLQRHRLMKVGKAFFILQVGWGVVAGVDNVLVLMLQGAGQAAVFSIAQRLFQFVSQPLIVMNAPLWAAYADASARNERRFISKTFKRSMALTSVLSALGSGVILLFGASLANWWTGGVVTPPADIVLMFFFLTIAETMNNALAVMLSGCGILRAQVVTVLILAVLALVVKLFVLSHWGVSEMLASYLVVYCLVVTVMYGVVYRQRIAKAF